MTLAGPSLGASGSQALDQLGITGSSGIISHLTGDAGVEVEQVPGAQVPSGALLIATDSSGAVSSFLDQLAHTICSALNGMRLVSGDSTDLSGRDHLHASTSPVPTASELSPSWAVDDGWAIVASTPAEVRAVIDAGGAATSRPHRSTRPLPARLGTSNTGMFYLNVQALVSAVRAVLPADFRATFDQQIAPYLAPVQAIGVSSHAFSDHITTSEFVLIR